MEIWGVYKLCAVVRSSVGNRVELFYINVILRYHRLRDPRFVYRPAGRVGLGPLEIKVVPRERPGGRGQPTRGTSTCCLG